MDLSEPLSQFCCEPKTLFFNLSCCCSVAQSCLTLCNPMNYSKPGFPCPLPSLYPGACSNSRPLSRWCHPMSSVLCHCLLLPPSIFRYFPKSQFFASGGQSIRASATASVLPTNIEGWFPLGLTGLISLQSKGVSRVFSSITVWKHQSFGAQPSLWFNSPICTWLLEKP